MNFIIDACSLFLGYFSINCGPSGYEDKKHFVYFDEISERILKNVPEQNKKYVKKQLDLLDENFMDYIFYWNEKYYRNGFCDGVQLIGGSFDN